MESLLFDAFIPAAYRHDSAGRWKAQAAERWLVFIARHLDHNIGGPDLAWWQLPLAVPGFILAVVVVVASGVVAAFLVASGVVVVAVAGVVAAFLVASGAGVGAGAVAGAAFLVASGVVVVAVVGVVVGAGAVVGVVAGVVAGGAAGAAFLVESGAVRGVALAWVPYETARMWLALRRQLPWQLKGFLADAHRRGVLRQAGAVHQFRHIELQHRLATRPVNKQHRTQFRVP